jgi:hypothetical protein
VEHDASFPEAGRLWLGAAGPGPQTRLFRRVIDSPKAIQRARIGVFAETFYHLWINGHYIGRGPVFHHPHRRPVGWHDLTEFWRAGRNVIAVLVHAPNIALHNSVPSGEPGLTARITARDDRGRDFNWDSDAAWRATNQSGWRTDAPRRGGVLGFIELFDVSGAPRDWRLPGFDDSGWPFAQVQPSSPDVFRWIDSGVPTLRWTWRGAVGVLGLWRVGASSVSSEVPPVGAGAHPADFGKALDAEAWNEDPQLRTQGLIEGTIRIDGLAPDRSAAVCLDLGKEYVGQILFECECPGAGVIDVGWSELLIEGRPPLMRKNCTYADRLYAVKGTNRWEPIGFSGGRYLALIFRGFDGPLTIGRIGMRATEPELNWAGEFHCEDEGLNKIWGLCARSLRVGVQEGLMDCPTREQAPYLGDGNLMGRWVGLLTGDWGHWRYLVRESFVRQSPDGLLRGAVFSGIRHSFIDYNLLAVIGARNYLYLSGDLETIRGVLEGCRRVFQWFDRRRDARGLVQTDWEEMNKTPQIENRFDLGSDQFPWAMNLFIDHPGLGWHNANEPGIDRRGTNAAINALYIVAARAMAELEEAAGHCGDGWRRAADETAAAMGVFFNAQDMAFADGMKEGQRLDQISQQTNTWCLWAGVCPPELERAVMQRVCDDGDARMARSGPYFWTYMLAQLARLGMHRQGLDHLRARWGRMIDVGATTLWETFAGDHLDSRCHPWSAAPAEFLLTEILGLGGLLGQGQSSAYRPRVDLLREARGTIVTAGGPASIGWLTAGDFITLQGELPEGMAASLILPDGTEFQPVRGKWEHRIAVTRSAEADPT